jgi:hypothetical protein
VSRSMGTVLDGAALACVLGVQAANLMARIALNTNGLPWWRGSMCDILLRCAASERY